MRNTILLLLLLIVLLPTILVSQIPRTISYQGVLTDDAGVPRPNGRYFFTFKLYELSSGGAAIWTQAESLQVDRGLFSTTFGTTPFGPTVLFDRQYWLGIQVGATAELAPRVRLSAVGYSINSISADTARIAGTIPNNSVTSAKIADGTIQFADVAQNGAATGQVMKWTGTSWAARNDSVGAGGTSSQWTTLASDIYYNGGNVGIGAATAPGYKLDILHGGSTGIRNRSSASFSTIDIDAFSGDAALRFAKAGVNQWNIRNRPADDYLEIFELGGGGSRVVIQNATGNVGIGATVAPAYKLDVEHGGASGIRSKSTASFSVVDIDAVSGDAALRFAKAGVNQWNIRNNPATDALQFFELGGGGERMRIDNTTGAVHVIGTLSKGGGSFMIDHPLDPANKYLYHSFVESPDMMNIYNGNIVTDGSGKAVVTLPDYFEALNMEFRYQLTVIGTFAQAIISRKVQNNRFEIATNLPNIEVSWMVTGVRHDSYANMNRVPNAVEKESANKGKYLHPAAFNLPPSRGIGYDAQTGGANSLTQTAPVVQKPPDAASQSGGSLDPAPVAKAVNKPVDNTGSVVDTPANKR